LYDYWILAGLPGQLSILLIDIAEVYRFSRYLQAFFCDLLMAARFFANPCAPSPYLPRRLDIGGAHTEKFVVSGRPQVELESS